MADKTIDDIVQEALTSTSLNTPSRDPYERVKQLAEEIQADRIISGETDTAIAAQSILAADLEEMTKNFVSFSPTTDTPVLKIGEDGIPRLVLDDTPVDLTPIKTQTIEKTIVEREITVSSDQVDKQTVNEIDFDKNDFSASRDGDVLTVSLKGELGAVAYVSSTDPSLTQSVKEGEFWFWTLQGKLYIRYGSFWVQPHPS